jgi:hypothetical protein
MAPQVDEHGLESWKVIEWEGMEPKVEEEIVVEKPVEEDKKNKKKAGKGP